MPFSQCPTGTSSQTGHNALDRTNWRRHVSGPVCRNVSCLTAEALAPSPVQPVRCLQGCFTATTAAAKGLRSQQGGLPATKIQPLQR